MPDEGTLCRDGEACHRDGRCVRYWTHVWRPINGAKRLTGRPHSAAMLERTSRSISHAGFDQASNSLSQGGFVRLLVRPGFKCCARLLGQRHAATIFCRAVVCRRASARSVVSRHRNSGCNEQSNLRPQFCSFLTEGPGVRTLPPPAQLISGGR